MTAAYRNGLSGGEIALISASILNARSGSVEAIKYELPSMETHSVMK